jgi:hypothetical protein
MASFEKSLAGADASIGSTINTPPISYELSFPNSTLDGPPFAPPEYSRYSTSTPTTPSTMASETQDLESGPSPNEQHPHDVRILGIASARYPRRPKSFKGLLIWAVMLVFIIMVPVAGVIALLAVAPSVVDIIRAAKSQ